METPANSRPYLSRDFLVYLVILFGVLAFLFGLALLLVVIRWQAEVGLYEETKLEREELAKRFAALVTLEQGRMSMTGPPGMPVVGMSGPGHSAQELIRQMLSDPRILDMAKKMATEHGDEIRELMTSPEGQQLIQQGMRGLGEALVP